MHEAIQDSETYRILPKDQDLVMKILSAKAIKAYWAFSEFTSERWGNEYKQHLPELVSIAENGRPFEELPESEYDRVIGVAYKARNSDFINNVDKSSSYRLEKLTREQLDEVWVLPTFHPKKEKAMKYREFRIGSVSKNINGDEDDADPRFKIRCISEGPYTQTLAGIVINVQGHPMLIEGYLRSLLFRRGSNPDDRYGVWWPYNLPVPEAPT